VILLYYFILPFQVLVVCIVLHRIQYLIFERNSVTEYIYLIITSVTVTVTEFSYWNDVSVFTNIKESAFIEFHNSLDDKLYNIHLKPDKFFLYITCQVLKEDGSSLQKETVKVKELKLVSGTENVKETSHVEPYHLVAPVNGLGSALFSQYDMYTNDTLVSQANNLYPYRGAVESILNYGSDYKHSQASLSLYYEEKNPEIFSTEFEDGFKTRYQMVKESSVLELMVKPCADIFHLSKYLITGTAFKLKFTRSSNDFCLLQPSTNSKKYKLKILTASLFILSHQLFPSLRVAHKKILSSGVTA